MIAVIGRCEAWDCAGEGQVRCRRSGRRILEELPDLSGSRRVRVRVVCRAHGLGDAPVASLAGGALREVAP